MPFRHEFKLSGSYTFPYDIQVNAAFQSYSGPIAWHVLEHRFDDRLHAASGLCGQLRGAIGWARR